MIFGSKKVRRSRPPSAYALQNGWRNDEIFTLKILLHASNWQNTQSPFEGIAVSHRQNDYTRYDIR